MAPAKQESIDDDIESRGWGAFSPLTRRILAVNVIALAILGGGILYLDQFRNNLIDTHIQDLRDHAEIIAAAIGESAAGGPESTEIEVDSARQIIGRLVGTTESRARLYVVEGGLAADSRFMNLGRAVYAIPLPPPGARPDLDERLIAWFNNTLDELGSDQDLPLYRERADQTVFDYEEAVGALEGETATMIRRQDDGTQIISVAVPVQRFRRVLGVLLMTAEIDDVQAIIQQERLTIVKVFGMSLAVTLLLSVFLAGTIARPIRRLANAADEVGKGIGRSSALHEFSTRQDEVGALSRSLSDMTRALYRQLDAVESFAADVAHELKNPLSSLRSAVETVKRTDDEAVRAKLLEIIQEDVIRLDRLITDISDASRLDAELSRAQMERLDLGVMTSTLVEAYRATERLGSVKIEFNPPEAAKMMLSGIDTRLSQVIRNLLDNAISFSPESGTITVRLRHGKGAIELSVEDEGPGLPEDAEAKIFDRFYSERPASEAFGKHSGLGLNISKQIVEAHSGTIRAENRHADGDDQEAVIGARFVVRLPV